MQRRPAEPASPKVASRASEPLNISSAPVRRGVVVASKKNTKSECMCAWRVRYGRIARLLAELLPKRFLRPLQGFDLRKQLRLHIL